MRYYDHRHALLGKLLYDLEHLARELGVERARRFVEKQHIRLHRQCARYRNALLLTARELAGIGVRLLLKTHLAQYCLCVVHDLAFVALLDIYRRIGDIFYDREVREEVEALENESEIVLEFLELAGGDILHFAVRAGLCSGLAEVFYLTRVRRLEEGRAAEQR